MMTNDMPEADSAGLRNLARRLHENIRNRIFRLRTRTRDFSIVSNNCWGADIYTILGLAYRTPFVGLFIKPECYLRLLDDFRTTIMLPLTFKSESDHPEVNELRRAGKYPLGCIGDDIEINFIHYASEEEAAAKWNRRIERITDDDNKLFVKFCDTDRPTIDQLQHFDALPFSNKVCFVGSPLPELKNTVLIPEYLPKGHVENIQLMRCYRKYFDLAQWLNGK